MKKASSRILYEDPRYLVGETSRNPDEHPPVVNNTYDYLHRRVLKELARSNKSGLQSALGQVGREVLAEMTKENIPLEELGWVLAKAAIREQEDYASHLNQITSLNI